VTRIASGAIEPLITDRTRAIIVTHAWGLPAEMDRVLEAARRRGLFVIEDCAESLFAAYKGRMTGTWGDVGCFSFQASKQLSTGDGGMATTSSDEIAAKLGAQAGAPTFLSSHNLDYNYRNDHGRRRRPSSVMPEFIAGLRRKAALFDSGRGPPVDQAQRGRRAQITVSITGGDARRQRRRRGAGSRRIQGGRKPRA
jgi:hypothetical protein